MAKQKELLKKKILLIEDDKNMAASVRSMFEESFEILWAEDAQDGLRILTETLPNLILLDFDLPNISGLEFLKILKPRFSALPVIMLTGHSEPETIIETMQNGAVDYAIKGQVDLEINLKFKITKAIERAEILCKNTILEKENNQITEENQKLNFKLADQLKKYEILGISKEIFKLKTDLQKLKGTSSYVLITGENGTGKELVARNLNLQEDDLARPFIAVNCAGIPANLFESEFFGHVKGAFTGASENKIGKFEAANGGDIFLDEIGEIPLEMQAKFLRVLQEKSLTRIGANKPIPVNFRVIAATNRNLEDEVKNGRFREDLYYRLHQINVHLVPLRQRPEDIEFLASHFLKKLFPLGYFSADALEAIKKHDWRGNIRELQNTIERGYVMAKDSRFPIVKSEHLMISNLKTSLDMYTIPDDLLPKTADQISKSGFNECVAWVEKLYLDAGVKLIGDNKALYEKLKISKAHYFRLKKSGSDVESKIRN